MQFRIILAILVLCVACNDRVGNSELVQADAIMESAPDSAMSILVKVDTAALSQFDKAYYSLLYSQAQIKTWVILDSDSLFRTAYEAFRDHPDDDLRRRAYFYNAQIAFNRGDMQSSMSDILNAYEIAKSEENDYWIAKSTEIIGDIFSRARNYPQSEKYRLEAIRYYKSAGRENSHRYALCDLVTNYSNLNLKEKGINLADSLKRVIESEQPIDSALMGYLLDSALPSYFINNRHEEILEAYENYLKNIYGDGVNVESKVYVSHVLQEQNDTLHSKMMMDEASNLVKDEHDRGFVLYAKYYQARIANDIKLAVLYCDSLLYYDARIVDKAAKESVAVVQRDFYNRKALSEKKRAKALAVLLLVAVIVVVLIVSLFIIIYRLKLKAKNAEIESLMSDFSYLKRNVEKVSEENSTLYDKLSSSTSTLYQLRQQLEDKARNEMRHEMIVEQLFHDKWSTFNKLCNDYFEMIESGQKPDRIVKDIEHELKELNTPKNIRTIEMSVDEYLGGIMTMLRNELPDFKEKDFAFIVFVIAGFSVRAICLILGIKYKNYYLIKSRLIRRIVDSEAPHKSLFLSKLGK